MGFERESFDKLMKVVWGKKSQMQQAMSRDSKGEPFIIRELEFKGAQTPSQLATALKVTSGRISTLLAALEKKGLIEREVDPNDRRIVHVNLTEQGDRKSTRDRVRLGPGTLYTILAKFEEEGFLQETAVEGRKRTYQLTES